MRTWFLSSIAAAALVVLAAAPVAAGQPASGVERFVSDPYVFAECDGYDVIGQDTVSIRSSSFFDRDGNWVRDVFHASDTAVYWRSDTDEQLATYSDAGGTFTATADGRFVFTGIHNRWFLRSGTTVIDRGRVVVEEVEPGNFQQVFQAGQIPETDPCTW